MPRYQYHCAANRRTVEVDHGAGAKVRTWGELCYAAGLSLGKTDPSAPVTRVIKTAPGVVANVSNSELRDAGFTKLVKRDEGVYENVTATGGEARYMKRGRKETMPHLHKKIKD